LAANDLLFLFTDGLYEIDDATQREYGQERLLEAVRARVNLAPERLFDEVLADVKGFSGNQEFYDDVCLVGVEVARVGRSVAAGGVP
jgi:serine phosphatase RsbU (regulator of sigma subunit)